MPEKNYDKIYREPQPQNTRLHTVYDLPNSPNLPQVLPSGYASTKLEKMPTNFKVYMPHLTWLCN